MMGVRYPQSAVLAGAGQDDLTKAAGTAALAPAAAAADRELKAAIAVAVVDTAIGVVERELADARRRQNAITKYWVPRLRETLRRRGDELEEAERADTIRLRWAAGRQVSDETNSGRG
jgi:vacuolar-type H+-ATPase subunit D/Vma8